MKLNRNLLALLTATATLSAISPADAATVFSHTFNEGTGALNGTTTDVGGLTWVAGSNWNANGVYSNTAATSAMVSFTPSAGFIYTLDAVIVSAENNATAHFGFADGLSTAAVGLWGGNTSGNDADFATNQIRGKAWTLMRNRNKQYALDGTSLAAWTSEDDTNLPGRTMRIVLDTTDTTWTAEYFLSSTGGFIQVEAPKNLTSNSITSVGFGNVNSFGQISSISLDAAPVPEPGSLALLGLGGLLIASRRRRA